VGLALAILVFAIVLVLLARDTNRQFNQTIRIRKDQEELNKQLQKALQDAAVADRAKTRFLASASHDLRQPIHALSLFGAALKMQQLPDNVRDLANNIDESITVLASQLDSLLDISRLDAGVVTPEFVVIDLTSMLQRIGREFEQPALEKGLSLNLELAGSYHIVSDKLLLERVIRNLLNNAVRYTETGRITIETRCDGPQCCLAISDTGIGIEESEQANIFSEFYQVSQQYGSSNQGLGLGLSIVARLLSLLSAPMTLKSTKGEGTRIEISLTLEANRKETREVSGMMRLEDVSVLVIDDDVAVRKAMTALLGNLGAEVRVSANLVEAMALASARAPDVVVSDLRLGSETGIDAITSIRDVCGDLPAILITGDTSTEQIQLAHESGLMILHKPVNVADLEKAIADAVSHCRA
jgi:signal transduction histidine kinase/ActR/RegA family two-component response regulator